MTRNTGDIKFWEWAINLFQLGLSNSLRQETADLFYHGYDNYMTHAFPEDELRPLTCRPLTRDRANPAHIELNDVLGNYSLTLIDSLSYGYSGTDRLLSMVDRSADAGGIGMRGEPDREVARFHRIDMRARIANSTAMSARTSVRTGWRGKCRRSRKPVPPT